MLTAYVPILVLSALVAAFAVGNLLLSDLAGAKRRNRAKGSAYECGMEPEGSAHLRLSIHFYLVAVLFILFDVESIFLVLWAVAAKTFAAQGVGALVFTQVQSSTANGYISDARPAQKGELREQAARFSTYRNIAAGGVVLVWSAAAADAWRIRRPVRRTPIATVAPLGDDGALLLIAGSF